MTSSRNRKGKGKALDPELGDDLAPTTPSADFLAFGEDYENKRQTQPKNDNRRSSGRRPAHHINDRPRDANPYTTQVPWADLVRWDDCTNVAEMLHYEVMACVDYLSALPEEHEVRRLVVEQIRRAVVETQAEAVVTPFGSYGTNLYLPSGDLDLVVIVPETTEVVAMLKGIGKILKRRGIAKDVTVVAKAKVPIVKFRSVIGNFHVDISVNQTNGINGAQVINQFIAEHPALRYLVVIIKAFLQQRSMNEVYSGGLGSYSIVCLALNFLQMHPKIRNGEIDPMENLGVLLIEFLELYGHYFNYHEVGISLHDGGIYYNKEKRGWKNMGQQYLLSIEDPLLDTNDVSSGTYGIPRVRKAFAAAFETISTMMLQRAGEIESRRSGTYAKLQKDPPSSSRSILSCILAVSQEVLDQRSVIMDLYESGTLQNMLGEPLLEKAPPVRVNPSDAADANPVTESAQSLDAPEKSKAVAGWSDDEVVEIEAEEAETRRKQKKRARSKSRKVAGADSEDTNVRWDRKRPRAAPLEDGEAHGPSAERESKRRRKMRNGKDALVEVDVASDNEESDMERMVVETASADANNEFTNGSRASTASRRAFWKAKAGEHVPDGSAKEFV